MNLLLLDCKRNDNFGFEKCIILFLECSVKAFLTGRALTLNSNYAKSLHLLNSQYWYIIACWSQECIKSLQSESKLCINCATNCGLYKYMMNSFRQCVKSANSTVKLTKNQNWVWKLQQQTGIVDEIKIKAHSNIIYRDQFLLHNAHSYNLSVEGFNLNHQKTVDLWILVYENIKESLNIKHLTFYDWTNRVKVTYIILYIYMFIVRTM